MLTLVFRNVLPAVLAWVVSNQAPKRDGTGSKTPNPEPHTCSTSSSAKYGSERRAKAVSLDLRFASATEGRAVAESGSTAEEKACRESGAAPVAHLGRQQRGSLAWNMRWVGG